MPDEELKLAVDGVSSEEAYDADSSDDDEAESSSAIEKKRIDIMRRYKEDHENGTNRLMEDERDNLGFYTGDSSYVRKTRSWKSDPRINYHKSAIEIQLSIIADQPTKINVSSRNGPDGEIMAGVYEGYLNYNWDKMYMDGKIVAMCRATAIWGSSALKGTWRPGKGKRPGVTKVRVLDPRTYMFDQDSTTNEELHESGSFSEFRFMTNGELVEEWPEDWNGVSMRKRLESVEAEYGSKAEALERELSQAGTVEDNDSSGTSREMPNRYLVFELWHRDNAMETVPVMEPKPVYQMDELTNTPYIDPMTNEPVTVGMKMEKVGTQKIPKYPNGRVSIALLARGGNDILIKDEPITYDRIPVVGFQEGCDPTRMFGISIIKNTRTLAAEMNRAIGAALDAMKQCGRPRMIVNKGLFPHAARITNTDGEVIESRGDIHATAKYLEPPMMMPDSWRVHAELRRGHDDSTGHYDVVKGNKPPNINAAAAIESLQSTALLRPRESVRAMQRGMSVMAEMMLENLRTFGADDTFWLTVTGDAGRRLYRRIEQYRKQEIQKQQGQNPSFVPAPEFGLPPFISSIHEYADPITNTALGYHLEVVAKHLEDIDIEVKIEAGLPRTESKVGRAEQAMVLAGMRDDKGRMLIPLEYLYEAIDMPNRDAIIQERKAQDDAIAQLQQVQQQFQQHLDAMKKAGIQLPLPEQGMQQPQAPPA